MKRLLSLCLFFCLLLSACASRRTADPFPVQTPAAPTVPPSPSSTPVQNLEQDDGVFTLLYSSGDTVNPYSCQTERNRELCSLLYETLFTVSPDFRAEPALCTAMESEDGIHFRLTLREGAVFSDGSELSCWDVLYSLNRARESGFYAARLGCIASLSQENGDVLITLNTANPSVSLRMDVPIVKEGTAYADVPLGSGRYVFQPDPAAPYLSRNRRNPESASLPCEQISLLDCSSDTAPAALQQGSVDLISDTPGNPLQQSLSGLVRHSFPTTVLSFLLADPSSAPLAEAGRRRLVSSILDRGELAAALGGEQTLTPLHPQMPDCDPSEAETWIKTDIGSYCVEILTEDYDGDGILEYLVEGTPTDFALSICVCSDRAAGMEAGHLLAEQLKQAGVEAELYFCTEDEFSLAVKNHRCDLYLASMRLTSDFDLTTLFSLCREDSLLTLAEEFRASAGETRKELARLLCGACAESSRLIPLSFARGAVYTRAGTISEMELTYADLFRNLGEWTLRELSPAETQEDKS